MTTAYRFGTFEVRPAERRVLVEGRPATLGARAFDLLVALIAHRDRVVSKDELLELVWPGLVVEENNLQVQVSTLRKILGNQSIATLPGRGYRFTLPIDGEDESAPSCPLPGFRHNLPGQLNSFVGREREIADLKEALENARLVTLTGTGGTGKTRLSLQVASQLTGEYADGVWFVELSPVAEAARVASVVAFVLGVKDEPGRSALDGLARYTQARTLLLILDNCEHVVAGCGELARRLLQAAPGLRILASSREPLHVAGEARFPVPALEVPSVRPGFVEGGAGTQMEALAGCEAVRLFVDRATDVRPGFRLTPDNAAAVAGICHRLEGIPLAIELAAARVATLPVERIAALLDDCFRVLTGGDRAAPTRQQALRASIDWSHDLLSSPERLVFRRLAVFSGGWTLSAAECVVAGGDVDPADVLDLLTQLVEKSLVEIDARGERYRLLETVRQYAAELLAASGERDEVCRRHVDCFVELVDTSKRESAGPRPALWLARLAADQENLLAALSVCDGLPAGATLGLRLSRALRHYWIRSGQMALGLRVATDALARMPASDRTAERTRALFDVGQLNYYAGNFVNGKRHLEECLAIAREIGDKQRVEYALQPLGLCCVGVGEVDAGLRHLEEAVALARELSDPNELAAALNNLAQVHRTQGALDVAEPMYQEVLTLATQMGNQETVAIGLMNLAMLWIERRSPDRARALLRQVHELERETGSRAGAQSFLEISAGLAALCRQWQRTARFYGAAEAMAAQTGLHRDPADEAFLRPRVADAMRALGDEDFSQEEDAGRAIPHEEVMEEARAWLEEPVTR
jgi:non-specific serine/threonine protein kinase